MIQIIQRNHLHRRVHIPVRNTHERRRHTRPVHLHGIGIRPRRPGLSRHLHRNPVLLCRRLHHPAQHRIDIRPAMQCRPLPQLALANPFGIATGRIRRKSHIHGNTKMGVNSKRAGLRPAQSNLLLHAGHSIHPHLQLAPLEFAQCLHHHESARPIIKPPTRD